MTWLDPLLDPEPFVRRAQRDTKPDARVGLALLIEGRLLLYRAAAETAGWPDLGQQAPPRADAAVRLLSAVGMHLTGGQQAEEEYRRLARARPPGMATLALLLLSFLYSDTGRGTEAIKLLRRRAAASLPPLELTLLRLQLGMRLAELPDMAAAIAETEGARKAAKAARSARWRTVVDTIAQHNLFAYEMRAGVKARHPLTLPGTSGDTALTRSELLYAEGLVEFLGSSFERSLADPYTRTIKFQAADPIEVPLRGALVRSELLAEWQEVRRARMLLGRYLVISRLGTGNGVPAAALELLRRAGDAKGVEATSRTIARMGPLDPLRLATEALIGRGDLGEDEPQASFRLLAEGADLLDESEAATAAAQLMARRRLFIHEWSTSPQALAALVRGSPSATQSEAALFLRMLLSEPTHGGLVQALSRVVEAIRWTEVDASERNLWLALIRETFGSGTDAHFVALRALIALASVESRDVAAILEERFTVQPSLELLAITFDSFDEPPQWARQHAWPLVSAALAEIRTQAAGGSYGFGMLDIANLAISVLQYRQRDHKAWAELVAFLLDPRVGMSAKARALERLGRRETRVPQQARAQLRNGLATMSAFVDELGSPPESFVAGKLRLASRIGGLSRDEILVTLLELAGEANAVSRMLAASVLSSVQTRVGAGVASTIALMLAHDANHDVRGAAARALAQLTGTGQETLEEARHERLRTLLAESGVVVPYGALAGLYDAASANEATDDSLLLPVQLIATQHPSRTVRVGAQTLIALLDRTATSAKPRQPRPLPRASSRGKS